VALGAIVAVVLRGADHCKVNHREAGWRVVAKPAPRAPRTRPLVRVLGVRSFVVVRGTRDERVAAIAALQLGRISRRQLHAVGVTDNMIATMCAGGRLHRLYPGVYAAAHADAGIRLHRTRHPPDRDVRIHQCLPVTSPPLPTPEISVDLYGYVPDLLWREQRLIVEVDGWEFHRGRGKFENDRRRDASLIAAGWLVLRFTGRQIRDQPYAVIARIAQTLGWRSAALERVS
jgi:Protein of unknown function (DUF559)